MQSTLKNQNLKLSATKRIMKYNPICSLRIIFASQFLFYRDIKDLDRCPIAGIGVHIPDMQDPFTIHCNVSDDFF